MEAIQQFAETSDCAIPGHPEERQPKFKAGQKFTTRGKHPRICTIVDIHTTRNSAGHLVRFVYVATHEFCGQTVTDRDVCEVTVARGLLPD
jgi:hypothetical protein